MEESKEIWVVGGEQRGVPHWTREWRLYKKAAVVKVAGGQVKSVLEYKSPPEHCCDNSPSIVFKAASIVGNRVYLCTQTEVLICDFPSFAIRKIISLPIFNDLHHVAVALDGRLFVAVTGLDAVAELEPDGTLLRLQSVAENSVWNRFSKTTDYRKVATTKPHLSHPNFVFFLDGEPWVTRFQQRDAVPLYRTTNSKTSILLGSEGAHDGRVSTGYVYFTAVNGFVLRFDLTTQKMQTFDLNAFRNPYPGHPLGWCRGIHPVDVRTAWVGFSRIRYTPLRQNLDWARRGFRHADRHPPAPTRIACYDLLAGTLLEEIGLEGAGMNTVFSVHVVENSAKTSRIVN